MMMTRNQWIATRWMMSLTNHGRESAHRLSMKKTLSKKLSPNKKKKDANKKSEDDFELKEGQEVVGTVVQAPKTGRGMYASDSLLPI
jgi:hypothetical protein